MNFWNEKRVRLANPKAKFYNFYDGWSAKGIKITHGTFEDGNIAIVRMGDETIGISEKNLEKIFDKVSAIVCTNAQPFLELNIPIIEVPDLNKSVIYFAKFIRRVFKGKVIAVTGSSGKSTVTKMFYDVLEQYGVSSNLNQANTTWGISWNMSNFSVHVPYWAIETSLGGGMTRNSLITRPDYAIVTNVAPVHLKEHQSVEDIARNKARIFDAVPASGVTVIYREMQHYDIVANAAAEKNLKIITVGESENADVKVETGDKNIIRLPDKECIINPYLPRHIVLDMAFVLAVINDMGLSVEDAVEKLNQFQALAGRGEIFKGKIQQDREIVLVDEAFNANPLSMKAALEGFGKMFGGADKSRVLILGDMAEGGPETRLHHIELAETIKKVEPSVVLLCGQEMKALWEIIKEQYSGEWYPEYSALNKDLLNRLKDGDYVLVKASHSIFLYKIVNYLKVLMAKYNESV